MSFKENLLKKIEIDRRRYNVLSSLSAPASGARVDRDSMKYLLNAAGLMNTRFRNIEMYIDDSSDDNHIFVLDNELAIYNTSMNDVALRKEPTLKEMISIRNAIKILNDTDVIISKKEASVETVYNKSIERLDLTFSDEDIRQLEYDGRSAVEWKDSQLIKEVLLLFSELLSFTEAPGTLLGEHVKITGRKKNDLFGPSVIYNFADDSLKLVKKNINLKKRENIDHFLEIVKGHQDADYEGPSVIKELAGMVLDEKPGKLIKE